MGLILTLITGLSFFGGYILSQIYKNQKKVSVISVSLSFIIILNLILLDIIPEIIVPLKVEYSVLNIILSIVFIILGIGILLLLDKLIPHHHHDHHEKEDNFKEHNGHIEHISKISFLALIMHNILECMALYLITRESLLKGFLMTLAICLHNIPLGLQMGSGLKKDKLFYLTILSLSGLIGGIICLIIGAIPEIIEHLILCFTLGMLIYLLVFELLKELYNNRKNIYSLYGIIIGVIVVIIINAISLGL